MPEENQTRRPILYRGELYTSPIEKPSGGPPKQPVISYEEARQSILLDLNKTKRAIQELPDFAKLPNEVVLCLRMDPQFSAKTYYPSTLFNDLNQSSGIEEIGSRLWRSETKQSSDEDVATGKLFFLRATMEGLGDFENKLNKAESDLNKGFKVDIRRLAGVSTLRADEQILGVPSTWEYGRLEAVLHPFGIDKGIVLEHFLKLLDNAQVEKETIRFKQYDKGVTFISFFGGSEVIEKVANYNPLRTLHPLKARSLATFRGASAPGAPQPPVFREKSAVIVGMFDGGVHTSHPCLAQYVEEEAATSEPAVQDFVEHGTQVAGAILYGPLNSYNASDTLPEPAVSVKSFRVLPTSNKSDIELYEVIDAIEEVVPKNPNIKVYNLSLGPEGPILDDYISRFTFSCDLLHMQHGTLFCVAVGNDGEAGAGYDRIQSPSDIVNGLGVGAYTKRDGQVMKAPYSCIGPGREGNKLKPDLLAFGGCEQTPIHLLSTTVGNKNWNRGTSFAAPIVSGYAGQLIGRSSGAVDGLAARAMLIHSSMLKKQKEHDLNFGHGIIPDTLEEVVTCNSGSYTLIYQGELPVGKFAEVEIPWVNIDTRIKASFSWTVAVATPIDPHSPDDYTTGSLMTSFYPNRYRYAFHKDGKQETVDISANKARGEELLAAGWKVDSFPVSEASPVPYATEDKLRGNDMKWDTVDCRTKTKFSSGINEPMFHLHALARGKRYKPDKVKYVMVLTVSLPEAEIDLYAEVLKNYSALSALKLQLATEVPVTLST